MLTWIASYLTTPYFTAEGPIPVLPYFSGKGPTLALPYVSAESLTPALPYLSGEGSTSALPYFSGEGPTPGLVVGPGGEVARPVVVVPVCVRKEVASQGREHGLLVLRSSVAPLQRPALLPQRVEVL